ncbi:MAG: pseudouridine synthase [Candidatus Cryptobacteroides sp.]
MNSKLPIQMEPLPEEYALSRSGFPNPFRYAPTPAVREAARRLMQKIKLSPELSDALSPGKMLGVLVVRDTSGNTGYLSAFSGLVDGKSRIEGFVPPIFDLTDPDGHYRGKEQEISAIVQQLRAMETSADFLKLKEDLGTVRARMSATLEAMRGQMAASRFGRAEERSAGASDSRLSEMARQSQFEKAEYRRTRQRFEDETASLESRLGQYASEMASLKRQHRRMSDELQKWIFENYTVHNALGDVSTVWQIFAGQSLTPPGGTGECAAPKLLEYAYRNGLEPLSMGEFWYGKPSGTAVRVQGHFYPSCTSKCGPLLGFMLKGLDLIEPAPAVPAEVKVLHSDSHIIVVSKPSGLPSVPGTDGKKSVLEHLEAIFGGKVFPVHRLDMDTSGLMVYARTPEAQAQLQRQFEARTVSKTYIARLCPAESVPECSCGSISLPLGPDYDERPRQKVDRISGKEAVTGYRLLRTRPDGTSDILFHPLTGRTHQLRVHSAHPLGLGRPIVGDLLYGGSLPGTERLCLHARSLGFNHPATGERLEFECET